MNLGNSFPERRYLKTRAPDNIPPRWAEEFTVKLPRSSQKIKPNNSIPKIARSKYLGFMDRGNIKKSKRLMGLSGLLKQK